MRMVYLLPMAWHGMGLVAGSVSFMIGQLQEPVFVIVLLVVLFVHVWDGLLACLGSAV